jgi:DNA polymerase
VAVVESRIPAEIVEWLRYLREIGVRELRITPAAATSIAAPAESGEATRSAATAPADPVANVTSSRGEGEPPRRAPRGRGLFVADASPPPEDPARALQEIREELGECERCKLCAGRTKIVFGVGNPRARLMFIGEGPGAEEDARGEPFVGRAGKKLDEMIQAIGLERSDVYIANIVKCRPPENRDPQPDEISTCAPFLYRQIDAIRPVVIVTLGSPATKTLLETKQGITKLRGSWHEFAGIPVMPTFHPAYLLRAYTVENRTKVWQDLKAARNRMDSAE